MTVHPFFQCRTFWTGLIYGCHPNYGTAGLFANILGSECIQFRGISKNQSRLIAAALPPCTCKKDKPGHFPKNFLSQTEPQPWKHFNVDSLRYKEQVKAKYGSREGYRASAKAKRRKQGKAT
jgi:hypothetical protein